MSGDPGSGAGKGGGGGGAIRSAGGGFGKMEAAREEEYFYKKVFVDKINLIKKKFGRKPISLFKSNKNSQNKLNPIYLLEITKKNKKLIRKDNPNLINK